MNTELTKARDCESNPESLRFSVATPTHLTLKTSKLSTSFWELPGDKSAHDYLETKDELVALVDSLRKEAAGKGASR